MIYVKKLTKETDLPLVADWMSKDSYHADLGIKPEDAFEDGTETALICDEEGPIMVARFHKALRAAVQFNPETRLRNARAGKEVAEWFQQLAKKQGAKEVIIRPGGKAVKFTEKLGFREFTGKVLGV